MDYPFLKELECIKKLRNDYELIIDRKAEKNLERGSAHFFLN